MKLLQLNLWGRVAIAKKRLAQEVVQFGRQLDRNG